MSTGGYILLHRKSLTSEVFADATLWRVWTWMLLRANHKPDRFRGVDIPRGSFATGMRSGAEQLGMPQTTFHRSLKRIAKMGMCGTQVERGFTVVTIYNYDTYQNHAGCRGTQVENKWNAGGTQAETREETQEPKEPLPPLSPPSVGGSEPPPEDSPDWGGVGEALQSLGMTRRDQAVAAARSANVAPETVQAIVDHWQANAPAWGPGALFERICAQTANGPAVSEGWPSRSEEAERERRREEAERQRKRQQAMFERQREQAAQDRKRLADLEHQHGRQIDSWSHDRMAEALGPLLAKQLPADGPPTGLARAMLLEHAASVSPQPR